MFASIRRYKTDPDKAVHEAQRAKDNFLPLITKMRGFVAFYHVIGDNGEFITVSFFEEKAQAEESNRLASDWVGRDASTLVSGPPEILVGVVAFYAEKPGGKP